MKGPSASPTIRRSSSRLPLNIEEALLEFERPQERKALTLADFVEMPDEARDRLRSDVLKAKEGNLGRAYGPNGKQIQKTLFEAIQ